MIPLPLRDVVALTGGALHPTDPATDPTDGSDPADAGTLGDLLVDGTVTTDSRECGPGSLFVARVGEHADGHAFAAAARAAGAVAVLGERPVPELPTVVVPDVQAAFGALARGVHDRARAGGLRTVAITGSSGKTSTKDLLGQVLAAAGETVAPVGSYNGEIGVPLTVCRVTPATRFLVAEMGARGVGHIAYLTRIAPPDVAVVLNVGLAHVGEFGSQDAIARAKGELVEALGADGTAVLNADDPRVLGMAGRTRGRVVTVGVEQPADVTASDVVLDAAGRASFTLHGWGRALPVRLAVSGAHQVGNALSVVAASVAVGLDPADAVAALARRRSREPLADGGPRARGRRHRRQRRLQRQPRLDGRGAAGAARDRRRAARAGGCAAPYRRGARRHARARRPGRARRTRGWGGSPPSSAWTASSSSARAPAPSPTAPTRRPRPSSRTPTRRTTSCSASCAPATSSC